MIGSYPMKAAVLHSLRQPLRIVDLPVPQIGPGEILIETRTCGICRTDLHLQDGLAYVPALPHTPGHEPAGVVVQVGPGVSNVAPGDRVVPHLFLTCGECRNHENGKARSGEGGGRVRQFVFSPFRAFVMKTGDQVPEVEEAKQRLRYSNMRIVWGRFPREINTPLG